VREICEANLWIPHVTNFLDLFFGYLLSIVGDFIVVLANFSIAVGNFTVMVRFHISGR
jgi:hypothetical protein